MKKLLKWILAALATLVLLLVIAAIVLPLAVDPNNYKDEIRAAVYAQTGRELILGGEIKWTVFPWVGLTINDLELSNPAGFGDHPMLSIGKAGAAVNLLPLFSKKMELGKITLNDLSLNLQRKADGRTNWASLSDAQSTASTSPEGGTVNFDSLLVSEIEISNANIAWDDAGQITELKDLTLTASNIELGRPFDLEGGFSLQLDQSQLAGEVRFHGQISSQADGAGYGIDGLEFSFKGTQGSVKESKSLDLVVAANADLDVSSGRAQLTDFSLRFNNVLTTGKLTLSALNSEPKFEGEINIAEFDPRLLFSSIGLAAPLTANDEALTSLRANMRFTGSTQTFNIQNLSVKLDQTSLEGRIKIENFDRPELSFDLRIDTLDVDDYLMETETTESDDLKVDVFRGFSGGGDFKIDKLIVAGLVATDLSLKISSDGNGIRLFPINAQFYAGHYQGDVKIDASRNHPILTLSQVISGVQAEDLLQDLTGDASLEGRGDFNTNLRTDLSNADSVRQALSGDFSLNFNDGAIVGFNVAESIRTAKAALGLGSEPVEDSDQNPKTDFSELTMTGIITQGILRSDDLKMLSPLLRVTGKGHINLVDESIDFLVKPIIVGTLEGQGGQGLEELSGVPIPVKITGNLYEPDIGIDFMAAVSASQKAKINTKKDEFIGQLLGGVPDETDAENTDESSQTKPGESDQASEDDDPVGTLFKGLLGGKKDKKKDDGGG